MAGKLDLIIAAQTKQGELLATLVERQSNFHERIFGHDGRPGALEYLNIEIKAVDVKLNTEKDERIAADGVLTKSHGEIKSKITLWTGIATGAGAVIGWALKLASPKLTSMFH